MSLYPTREAAFAVFFCGSLNVNVLGMEIFMLRWKKPEISDGEWIRSIVAKEMVYGSDAAFANIFLLRDKYNIEIADYKGAFIRRYNGQGTRCGYTFPLGKCDLEKALMEIVKDSSKRGEMLQFAFLTEAQKEALEKFIPQKFVFESDDGDSDYIYLRQELADLSGKVFHKKKNHVSKFMRTYKDWEYQEIGDCNWEDAERIADRWYDDHIQQKDKSQMIEYRGIKEALFYFEKLELMGGILYANGTPCAMTIASNINNDAADVHFEKSIGEFAVNGGYAAINNMFAKEVKGVQWLNREEDINIEGLRRAKMSYRPKMLLKKYHAYIKEVEDYVK